MRSGAVDEVIPLKRRTSLAVGGIAERAYIPENAEEFRRTYFELRSSGEQPFILGGGCNTLFSGESFNRPLIATEKLRRLSVHGSIIRAESGVRLEALIRFALRCGLGGVEIFTGIPGTVGGAVAMNAGGFGFEFGGLVRSIKAVDPASGEFIRVPGESIEWRYRGAPLSGLAVVEVELQLEPAEKDFLRRRAVEFMRRKAATQPLACFSAGCVFKNPPGDSAARLIDEAGLKGERVGHAEVSCQHANFIVNRGGGARSADVLALIEHVRDRVLEMFGVRLELEIVLAGQD